jgi:hypothetical protein
MSTIVSRLSVLWGVLFADVPIGTPLGLFWRLWALISGRFLLSRGAVLPALADGGLPADAVRRSGAALAEGPWAIQTLVRAWSQVVQQAGRWHAQRDAGCRPVACDVVGCFRPHLSGGVGQHDQSGADTALPALVLAVVTAGGAVGNVRRPLRRLLLRADPSDRSEAALQRRAVTPAGAAWPPDAVLVVDAGCGVAALLTEGVTRCGARVARHVTARRHGLPAYTGRGRCAADGERGRPVPRLHTGKMIAATPPEAPARWGVAGRLIHAQGWDHVGLSTAQPGPPALRGVVLHDPRSQAPLGFATHLPVSASARWCLSRARWPVEQVPLAAKQRRGAQRACVCGSESRHRRPELALLAGTGLTSVAATAAAVATGCGERCCRPTCGRLRRVLRRVEFSAVPVPGGPRRKKASVTVHVPTGVRGHRRQKGLITLLARGLRQRKAA